MKLILVIYIPIQTKIVANIAKKDILYLNTAMNVKYEAPEHCKKLENDICTECDHFFKLTEDNKCERTSCYEYEKRKMQMLLRILFI